MKKITIAILVVLGCSAALLGQKGIVIENKATHFSIEQPTDTIDFIVVDTVLQKKKPIFLWCQGSLPVPLFAEIEGYGYYFLGGGIENFNYRDLVKQFHVVVISMPKTPVLAKKENLNQGFQFIPNPKESSDFSAEFIRADDLSNYVRRAQSVLAFLKTQDWVDQRKLVVAGHSQGSKIASKIAVQDKSVTHLGLFGANPFGRIDQMVREARLNAQMGKISWEQADSIMTNNYELFKQANDAEARRLNPSLNAWKSFSETFYDDWLSLDIPIYLAYGTEDRVADLCDIVPFFFIEQGKNNLTLKRCIGLEHNFFEVDEHGRPNYEKGHWPEVIVGFLQWLE